MQCSLYSQIKWTKACILLTFLARGSFFIFIKMIYTSCGPATYTFFKHSFCYFEGEHVDVLYTHELKLERELVQAYDIHRRHSSDILRANIETKEP